MIRRNPGQGICFILAAKRVALLTRPILLPYAAESH